MESVHETMNKVLSAISLSHSNPSAVNTQILKIHKQHIFEMKIFLLKAVVIFVPCLLSLVTTTEKKKKSTSIFIPSIASTFKGEKEKKWLSH